MTRDIRLYLQDIVDSIEKIQRYTESLTFAEFELNDMVIDAVVRNFEVIGEAAGHCYLSYTFPLLTILL